MSWSVLFTFDGCNTFISVPPVAVPPLPALALSIVWICPAVGFLTPELGRLNYQSPFKLESSCQCPDMWPVGVIVFFAVPISNLPPPLS